MLRSEQSVLFGTKMKFCACIFYFAFIRNNAIGISCWNCQNANGIEDCERTGQLQRCVSAKDVCAITVRRENRLTKVFSQCKQLDACIVQMIQNNNSFNSTPRCNSDALQALCVCCCDAETCNVNVETCRENMINTDSDDVRVNLDENNQTCPVLNPFHGDVTCTNGFNIGSRCNYSCYDDYNIIPPEHSSLICLASRSWDKTEPCCALPCPSYAIFDVIVVSYSSSNASSLVSFEIENQRSRLIARDQYHGYLIARIEFSGNIHLANRVSFLGDISRSFEQRHNTPDGQVNIGGALNWTFENFRGPESGNRPDVRDIVVVRTDASSTDDVAGPARMWRDAGALVLAELLPDDDGNYPSYEQMLEMTVSPDRIFTLLNRSSEAIQELLADEISFLCDNICQHRVGL